MKTIVKMTQIVILTIVVASCSKDDSSEIEQELVTYMEAFVDEAAIRGITIDYSELDLAAYVENIVTTGTIGQCESYSDGSKAIVLDERYWIQASDLEREYVVFHELGHCVLGRSHDNSRTSNGTCTSIMQGGENICTGIYTSINRDQLLDELFDQ